MNCPMENRENEELLLNYRSGALDEPTAELFEAHMMDCAACREVVQGHKAVWEALDIFEPAAISADFDRRLYQRIEKVSWWQRMFDSLRSPMMVHRGLPVAAAAMVLAVAGYVWQRPAVNSSAPPAPLSAEVQPLQPEQLQHALDDMEMLREFNHLMRTEPSESKM